MPGEIKKELPAPIHAGRVAADKSAEAIRDVLRIWLTFLGKMEHLVVDQESALASDEMGLWLQRRGRFESWKFGCRT